MNPLSVVKNDTDRAESQRQIVPSSSFESTSSNDERLLSAAKVCSQERQNKNVKDYPTAHRPVALKIPASRKPLGTISTNSQQGRAQNSGKRKRVEGGEKPFKRTSSGRKAGSATQRLVGSMGTFFDPSKVYSGIRVPKDGGKAKRSTEESNESAFLSRFTPLEQSLPLTEANLERAWGCGRQKSFRTYGERIANTRQEGADLNPSFQICTQEVPHCWSDNMSSLVSYITYIRDFTRGLNNDSGKIDHGILALLRKFPCDWDLAKIIATMFTNQGSVNLFIDPGNLPDTLATVWKGEPREFLYNKNEDVAPRRVYAVVGERNCKTHIQYVYVGSSKSLGGMRRRVLQHQGQHNDYDVSNFIHDADSKYVVYSLCEWPDSKMKPSDDPTSDFILLTESIWQLRMQSWSPKLSPFAQRLADNLNMRKPSFCSIGLNMKSALETPRNKINFLASSEELYLMLRLRT